MSLLFGERPIRTTTCCALATIAICFAQTALPTVAETLSVNTTSSTPLATLRQDEYRDLIAIEVFKRTGRNFTIQVLPGGRSVINPDHGKDDATFVRIRGIAKAYPNTRTVPEKAMDWILVAITVDPKVKVRKWADLDSYGVAYLNGRKIFERIVEDAKFDTKVRNGENVWFSRISISSKNLR